MDLDRLGQRLVVSSVTLPGGMASFSTVGTGDTESAALNAARGSALTAASGPRATHLGTWPTRDGEGARLWVSRLRTPDPAGSHSEESSCRRPSQKCPPAVACSRERPAAHSPVMLFIHQVVPGPEGHQVSVVRRRRDRHRARAAHVSVTQLVSEDLQLVRREAVVVPEHVVVGGPACPLGAGQRVREGPGAHGRRRASSSQGTRRET